MLKGFVPSVVLGLLVTASARAEEPEVPSVHEIKTMVVQYGSVGRMQRVVFQVVDVPEAHWDGAGEPPLSADVALQIAKTYMEKLPPRELEAWAHGPVERISLECFSPIRGQKSWFWIVQ